MEWTHPESGLHLPISMRKIKEFVNDNFPFWRLVNSYVSSNGPFPPLKLFKHGTQSFYSKTKGGVEGATEYRSTLRSSMVVCKWEQKLFSQTIKSVLANAFIIWKLKRRSDLLHSMDVFKSIESYRNAINRDTSLGNFVLNIAPKLLHFADSIANSLT